MCTHSLLLPIQCPPLSSSPHPTLSLRLGESFLLCVSPPCGAEAGGRTGAPFSFRSSPLYLYLLIGHWWGTRRLLFIASTCHCKELALVCLLLLCQLSRIHSAQSALPLLSAPVERWDNTERGGERREGWRCRTQGGASHTEREDVYRVSEVPINFCWHITACLEVSDHLAISLLLLYPIEEGSDTGLSVFYRGPGASAVFSVLNLFGLRQL